MGKKCHQVVGTSEILDYFEIFSAIFLYVIENPIIAQAVSRKFLFSIGAESMIR